MIRVTIWNENQHETRSEKVAAIYPNGMHGAIADGIKAGHLTIRTATMEQPEHGLTDEVLEQTDVLIWWGHVRHDEVEDRIAEKVYQRVLEGMGFIPLHSAHYSKVFRKLMGTSCTLNWRVADEKERVWVTNPAHPIAAGIGPYFELPAEEMYGEFFDIPEPDELVFISWFAGGEVFRSGCTFRRGLGKIFYFRPGHETYPTFYNPNVIRIISNAIHWAAPSSGLNPVNRYDGPAPALELIQQ